jgi:hypothetical protein
MPKKKPIRKELTEEEKEANKKISSVRVLVENALSGVKRLRIVSDVFRGRKKISVIKSCSYPADCGITISR